MAIYGQDKLQNLHMCMAPGSWLVMVVSRNNLMLLPHAKKFVRKVRRSSFWRIWKISAWSSITDSILLIELWGDGIFSRGPLLSTHKDAKYFLEVDFDYGMYISVYRIIEYCREADEIQ